MTKAIDLSGLEPIADPLSLDCEPRCEGSTTISLELPCEFAPNSQLAAFDPMQPQFCRAIAEHYGVSRKAVQQWYHKVCEAYPWMSEADLKLPDDRYTAQCIERMTSYRQAMQAGLKYQQWKAQVWAENQEQATLYQAIAAATQLPLDAANELDEVQISRYAPNDLDYRYFSYGLPQASYQIAYQRPSENSLVHLVEQKLHNIALFNEQERLRVEDFDRALKDTDATLQALEDMSAVEQGIAKADRHEYLMQQAYSQRRQQHQIHRSQSQGAHPAPKPDPTPVGASG